MKLHILSDLHLEMVPHFNIKLHKTNADVLILAGDIGRIDGENKAVLIDFLKDCKEIYEHVIYVAGNHEFYFSEFYSTYTVLKYICEDIGIYFLQNEEVNIDGILFFGTTLWTDMCMLKYVKPVEHYLNDFNLVLVGNEPLTGQFVFDQNKEARKAIDESDANVFITHHIPLMAGVHPRYTGTLSNYGFANTELNTKGELWVYGHTHDSIDFKKNGTRFICNPKGYGAENLGKFEPKKVIEI